MPSSHKVQKLSTQVGTFSLLQQVIDRLKTPVIAAGGIASGNAIAAAMQLGAAGVQIGSRYLKTPESRITDAHRRLLDTDAASHSMITNVFTGKPARSLGNRMTREFGPMSNDLPTFPYALPSLAPLKAATEQNAESCTDFVSLWAGQSVAIGEMMDAKRLTETLAEETVAALSENTTWADSFKVRSTS